ncbi:hypothetical protein DH2020_002982 [Rehmannia glutinosa]|uniref:Protein kinase domain-containing protein n=1 Tax=Rehmannia glutinosa TaxID=99300 RepID=A0ABR0XVQ4_REHGL
MNSYNSFSRGSPIENLKCSSSIVETFRAIHSKSVVLLPPASSTQLPSSHCSSSMLQLAATRDPQYYAFQFFGLMLRYVLKKIRLARQTNRTRRSAHQELLIWKTEFLQKLCRWLVQLLIALDYLHTSHILHRDVKDIQALINKINKSIVAPLPAKYSGAFRGLVKSMLRRNPELRPSQLRQASELLKHPHLQPYVLNVHLKLNSPRRNSLPCQWAETETKNPRKLRFSEPVHVPLPAYRDRRLSCGNNRNLNPSISGAEQSYGSSTRITGGTHLNLHQGMKNSFGGSTHEGTAIMKNIPSRITKNQKATQSKDTTASKSKPQFSRNHELLPTSKSLVKKPVSTTRRASLPLPTKDAPKFRHSIKSPDVSVNAPRIDKMVEFPLASYEESFPIRRSSLASAQCSWTSPQGDRSIMKDKCTIEFPGKSGRPSFNNWQGFQSPTQYKDKEDGSQHSDQNATAGASSRTSSDQRRCRFDMSSYRQRAQALEGLLEFSARLMQEERIEELGVLLKPFGPGKVSPRETAIWLAKSFKENTLQPEDFHH